MTWRYQTFKRTISKYSPFFRFHFLQLFEKDEMGKIDVDHIEPKHKGNCPIFHILNKNQDTLPCPQWKHKKHTNTKRICVHHYWSQRSAIFLDTRNCHYQHQLFENLGVPSHQPCLKTWNKLPQYVHVHSNLLKAGCGNIPWTPHEVAYIIFRMSSSGFFWVLLIRQTRWHILKIQNQHPQHIRAALPNQYCTFSSLLKNLSNTS